MRGVNKVTLVGNLGADPETKSMPSGTMVANLRLATADSVKDKQTNEWVERTEWHRVSLFGRLAEVAKEYLRKGSKVYVEGSIRTRKWQDKEGKDRYSTEIVGNELLMLDGRQERSEQPAREDVKPERANPPDDFDDDIPFMWAALLPAGLAAAVCLNSLPGIA